MKRKYMKPYLAVESFQLNAAIAGACAGKMPLNHKLNECTLADDPGGDVGHYYFGSACFVAGGIDVVNSPDNVDGACYQVFNYNQEFLTS